MAEKKVDKEYVLSDSTVNVYGFRLLTSGYQLADFQKNPIGYYMHNRDAGVLLRWDDIRIDGDKVYGKPVINLSNARGQQTLEEVENGFLNAASVGHIIVLDYSMDPSLMLPGQTGPTITKWVNRECSLVDIPGNDNALCDLYDADDNLIILADLTHKNQTINMKQIVLSAASLATLSLAADADNTAIDTAIANLAAANKKLEGEKLHLESENKKLLNRYEALKAAGTENTVKALIDAALTDKRITKEQGIKLADKFSDDPEGLKDILDTMKPYVSVVDNLSAAATGTTAERKQFEGKSWDELDKSKDAVNLLNLKKKFPDLFKQKYEQEYGKPYVEIG